MRKASPLWLPPISLVAIALMVVLISFVRPLSPLSVTAQAALIVVLARAFLRFPAIGRWVDGMPVAHRVVLALLLFGMVAGHFTLQAHRFFPFVAWEIFAFEREEDPVSCREFIATTETGRTTRLLVEQLFPSIVQFDPPADNDSPTMGRLVDAMARVYNRGHAADPVRRVDLVRVSVSLHPPAGETLLPCELLKSFSISSDRSN
jgi:hypothetical protein